MISVYQRSIILYFSCLFLSIQFSYAQLEGIVIDISNRTPLPYAVIKYNNNKTVLTDNTGKFQITDYDLPITLDISYLGYEDTQMFIENTDNDLTIELKPAQYLLGEVVVSAYQHNQSILETPGSIALLPQKEFRIDNDVYIVPALNRIPGIYMHSGTYNTNRLTIRGIGSRSLFSTTKIRAYFKDIPLTTGDGETTIEDIDPDLLERVEVIKGPSSSIYGAGLGGTVLMVPKMPKNNEKSMTYRLSAGSYGYLKNSLIFDYGSEKHRLSVSVNNIHSDGYRQNNEFDRFSTGISYNSFIGPKTSLTVIGNFIDLKAFIPSSIDEETYKNDPQAAAANWFESKGYEDYFKIQTGINVHHRLAEHSILDVSVFNSIRDAYELRPFNILKENSKAYGGRLKYNYYKNWHGYRANILIGTEIFKDAYQWQTIENIDREEGNLISDNDEKRLNVNAFLKTDFQFPTGTEISLGVNVNRTDYKYIDLYSLDSLDNSRESDFGIVFSPRIAISHAIASNLNVYGTISHGFSPPTLPETLTPEGNINPDIQPEQGVNYEVGLKGFALKNRFYFDLALFAMDIKDLLVAQRVGEDEFIGVNAGRTQHNGIELTLNYELINPDTHKNKMTSFLTYTFSDYTFRDFVNTGIDYSGNRLTGVPRNVLNVGFSYKMQIGLYGNLNYQYVDRMPMRDDNSIYSDSYQLVNLRVGFEKRISSHFQLDFHVIINNLTNSKYASMISVNAASFGGRPPRYYYPGLPINGYGGVSLSYFL